MTTTTTTYAVCVGVADIRRDPDPNAELVTQALMNVEVTAGETDGEWTHVALSDYTGWISSNQLEEPVVKGFCKIGESCGTPMPLVAVITSTHTTLYARAASDETLETVYLSTALPLLDLTQEERVQVALPGECSAWLRRSDIDIRQSECIYPRAPISTITTFACAFLGRPYLWGGTTWEGIDCSGFVQLCYRMGGYIIPRDADQQHDFLPGSVKREELQAGDLIFFGSKEITHVAMALNNQQYIHAEGQNYDRVVINSFNPADANYYPRLDEIVWGIRRVIV
jgi:hypothetical protein